MRTSDPQRLHILLLLCFMLLQGIATLAFGLTLRYEIKSSGLDGMVYAQLLHNLIAGNGFVSSINPPYVPQHWMGIHFSPILFLLVPFYWLSPHIETLLAIGSIALALAAWPVYLTARAILQDSFQALVVALLYLINPFVFNAAVWDFHEVHFAPLCIAWMLWALTQRKPRLLLVISVVLLCIKEHYGLAVAGFGLLWAWHWKDIRLGAGMAAGGIAVAALLITVVIPHFNPLGKPMMMNDALPVDRFSWITSMESIRQHTGPLLLNAFTYGEYLLLPLLLLPLFALPWLLPAGADVIVNTLALTPMMTSPLSYHSAAIIPVLLVAMCVAVKALFPARIRIRPNDAMLPVAVLMASYSYLQLALPFSEPGNTWEFTSPQISYTPEDSRALAAIRNAIPADATISAQLNVLPHLRPQMEMYPLPERTADAGYAVMHLKFPYTKALNIFGTPFGTSGERYYQHIENMFANPGWGIVLADGRWVMLRKNTPDAEGAREQAQQALAQMRQEYRRTYENVTGKSY